MKPAILASSRRLAEFDAWELSAQLQVTEKVRARRSLNVESVVGLPRYWQRDIVVRGFFYGTAPVLKLVQIDSRFGEDPAFGAQGLGSLCVFFVRLFNFFYVKKII